MPIKLQIHAGGRPDNGNDLFIGQKRDRVLYKWWIKLKHKQTLFRPLEIATFSLAKSTEDVSCRKGSKAVVDQRKNLTKNTNCYSKSLLLHTKHSWLIG